MLLLVFLFAWIYLPETQGTTPAELQAELVKKNAGRSYHNMDIEGMTTHIPPTQDEWEEALAMLQQQGDAEDEKVGLNISQSLSSNK